MKPETLRAVGISCMLLLALVLWVAVLTMALHVSGIILATLDSIVELAAITE